MGVFSRSGLASSKNLDTISGYIKDPNSSEESKIWNYGKYAFITLATNGTNNAGLCTGGSATLGDTLLTKGADYNTLRSIDTGRDIPAKPILESVRINNDGSQKSTESALYSIDVSFKCFSASQFEEYESAFFRTGNGVVVSFGYKGLGLGSSITAFVHNFGFSLDVSGVYSCTLQLTGANRFSGVLTMIQEMKNKGTTYEDDSGQSITPRGIVGELNARLLKAFPDYEEPSLIQRKKTKDFVDDGEGKVSTLDSGYAVANVQTEGGGDFTALGLRFDSDDMMITYCSYQELVNVINHAHSGDTTWSFSKAAGSSEPSMGSADPTKLLLGGKMNNYGSDGDDTKNDFSAIGAESGLAKDFYLSLDFITEIIQELQKQEVDDKEHGGGATSVNNFLRVLNGRISDLTGGLYQLELYSNGLNERSEFQIANYRAEHTTAPTPYLFGIHNLGTVLTSVNMASNMDSTMAAAALVSNRAGALPANALDKLYSCGSQVGAPVADDKIKIDDVRKAKEAIGAGFSPSRVEDFKTALASYVKSNPIETKTANGYRYMIDLTVGHYGAWGAQVGDTFTFSGLPAKYKTASAYFCVGNINHTFDGQGGWQTEITGFLKLDAT